MLILFASDYFDIKKVDDDYVAEYEAVSRIPEFKPILYNYDEFINNKQLRLYPDNFYTGECLYRGWMLTPEQYTALYSKLCEKGIQLITSIDWQLVNNTFSRFMIKDAVKSVKGHDFPSSFETPVIANEMNVHVENFRNLRDKLLTGGILLKEYVDFKKYGNNTNEYRAFYLKNHLLSLSRNSNQPDTCPIPPQIFIEKWAKLPSNYFTVDFGELENGQWIVIETGDGQVSGLSPMQFVFKYYDDMRLIFN